MSKSLLGIGALSAFLAVALGAFGAHMVKDIVGEQLMSIWETAARYHFYHALAIITLAANADAIGQRVVSRACTWMILGTLLFSGSLYALTLTGASFLGPVTPVGGLCFLIGWALLIKTSFSKSK
ncbi:MAG: DUF423 domain-containing protein [Planctomycetes bacterium]|nr:DUF423 domain-containing protein [Planctomycetota bacterium]